MTARLLRLVGFAFPLLCIAATIWGLTSAVDLRGAEPERASSARARVARAIDGDTIAVRIRGAEETVRLIGLDAPESVHPSKPVECGGPEAAASLAELAPEDARIRLVRDPSQQGRDAYGRLLRYAAVGGVDVGRAQLRRGQASVYLFEEPFRRIGTYRADERGARRAGRGIWGSCDGDRRATR
jgi:micrococcal nuclease